MVASLPDISEFPIFTLDRWKEWFVATAALILNRCSEDGVSIFYQTDIKLEGRWIDKSFLCQIAAEQSGHSLLWHKITCNAPSGVITHGRPSYSHILCFSKELQLDPAHATCDVLPLSGEKTWQRGMGVEATMMIAKFVKKHTTSHTIINPFCGMGSMLAAANAFGLHAIGIERSAKRVSSAQRIQLDLEKKTWAIP